MRLLLISFCLFSLSIFAQEEVLILDQFAHQHHEKRDVEYIFKNSNFIVKYNPISLIAGGLMYTYQKVISPQISAECLYVESCSNFSVHLIRKYGILKGSFLSADRLTRCNQFAAEDMKEVRIDYSSNRVIDHVDWYQIER